MAIDWPSEVFPVPGGPTNLQIQGIQFNVRPWNGSAEIIHASEQNIRDVVEHVRFHIDHVRLAKDDDLNGLCRFASGVLELGHDLGEIDAHPTNLDLRELLSP